MPNTRVLSDACSVLCSGGGGREVRARNSKVRSSWSTHMVWAGCSLCAVVAAGGTCVHGTAECGARATCETDGTCSEYFHTTAKLVRRTKHNMFSGCFKTSLFLQRENGRFIHF